MRQSQIFGKTRRTIAQTEVSINAQLLTRAGFIEKLMAGTYSFLPLGLRVLRKIEAIVREEMDKIGTEILLPGLSPKDLWQKTGRLDQVDVLFQATGANDRSRTLNNTEYILNPTHEELVTPLAKLFNTSYRDLPTAVYQIQTKYRNEARVKSGLLRGREFRMKDLYSFHATEAQLKEYYELAKETYWQIFRRLGLADETVIALASGGDFTRDYSHEFQTRCATGEDLIFVAPQSGIAYNREVAPSAVDRSSPLYTSEPFAPMNEVFGEGIIGVDALAKLLEIAQEKTTKTMLYQTETGEIVAAAVRGDYEVNELKLKKILDCRHVQLAPATVVREVTGAEIGYAGLVGLPPHVRIVIDDALKGRYNFECGGNKTNYHLLNVNFERDVPTPERFYDIKLAKSGDLDPETNQPYEVFAASEIGNIFPLHTKFSEAFDYLYTDDSGGQQPVYMGSYGIGTSRIMGVLVEKFHDAKGIIWPKAVAPFEVHLLSLMKDQELVRSQAESVYESLQRAGIEVLYDDRDLSAGEKFSDADLIGIPVRLVISERTLAGEVCEWKERTASTSELIPLTEITARVQRFLIP